ncbi:hypothetical protein, partial [Anaerosolibacter sp.]|uniref:hypothetical protein n=1 Tax=Anaerosolibacter sp. TaxID=1872527 RepID=UPI0039F0221A
MNQERLKKIRENLILLLKSTFDMQERSTALIRKEAMDELDNFTLLCHADLLGLPIPTSYYT